MICGICGMCTSISLEGPRGVNLPFKADTAYGEKNSPARVMPTPVMFNGVNSSPKTIAETAMVVTSFAMPAIDIGTTPARLMMLVGCGEVRKTSCERSQKLTRTR